MTYPDERPECAGGGADPVRRSLQGMGVKTTGKCPVCEERFPIERDGTIARHDAPDSR
jgi:hypothetical protein